MMFFSTFGTAAASAIFRAIFILFDCEESTILPFDIWMLTADSIRNGQSIARKPILDVSESDRDSFD